MFFSFRNRKLKFLTEMERKQACNVLRGFIDKELQHSAPSTYSQKGNEPKVKKGRFDDFADSSEDEFDAVEQHELDRYLAQRINIGELSYKQNSQYKKHKSFQ